MKSVIFDKDVNTFARKFLIKDNGYNQLELLHQFKNQYNNIEKHIANLLLDYDTISFNLYGENIIIAILLNMFGLYGLEFLIEQGSLNFLLNTSIITYLKDDISGVNPL